MTNVIRRTPPGWFWLVVTLTVLWGAAGCYAFYLHITLGADAMGPATDYDRALYASMPGWYNPVYAVAVVGGLLGGLALLARKAITRPLFILSLIAVIVQFGYLFAATDLIAVKGIWTVYFPAFIFLVALAQVWFAGLAIKRGWIG